MPDDVRAGGVRFDFLGNASQFIKETRRASSAVARSRREFNQLRRTVRNAASSLASLGVGFVGLAGISSAVRGINDFEKSLQKIVGLVGIARPRVEEFREGILALSAQLGRRPTELADALFVITSAGARGTTAIRTLREATLASVGGLGSTAEIARAATAAVTAYGEANLSAKDSVAVLVGTVRAGNLEAETLAPVLGRLLPTASELGLRFNELGSALAFYTRIGFNAAEATTGVGTFLRAFLSPTARALKLLGDGDLEKGEERLKSLQQTLTNQGIAEASEQLRDQLDGNRVALRRFIGEYTGFSFALAVLRGNAVAIRQISRELEKVTQQGADITGEAAQSQLAGVRDQFSLLLNDIVVGYTRAVGGASGAGGLFAQSLAFIRVNLGLVIKAMLALIAVPIIKHLGRLLFSNRAVLESLVLFRRSVRSAGVSLATFGRIFQTVSPQWQAFTSVSRRAGLAMAQFRHTLHLTGLALVNFGRVLKVAFGTLLRAFAPFAIVTGAVALFSESVDESRLSVKGLREEFDALTDPVKAVELEIRKIDSELERLTKRAQEYKRQLANPVGFSDVGRLVAETGLSNTEEQIGQNRVRRGFLIDEQGSLTVARQRKASAEEQAKIEQQRVKDAEAIERAIENEAVSAKQALQASRDEIVLSRERLDHEIRTSKLRGENLVREEAKFAVLSQLKEEELRVQRELDAEAGKSFDLDESRIAALEERLRLIRQRIANPGAEIQQETFLRTDQFNEEERQKGLEKYTSTIRDGERALVDFGNSGVQSFNDINEAARELGRTLITSIISRLAIEPLAAGFAGTFGAAFGIPGFADGGLAGRGLALVGERGPELVNFNRPAYVHNNDELRNALSGNGGVVVNYNPVVNGADAVQVRRVLDESIPEITEAVKGAVVGELGRPSLSRDIANGSGGRR